MVQNRPPVTAEALAEATHDARTHSCSCLERTYVLDDFEALLTPPAWHRDALCKEYPEVNFVPYGGSGRSLAVTICSRCLVRDECRAWALDQRDSPLPPGSGRATTGRQRRARETPAA